MASTIDSKYSSTYGCTIKLVKSNASLYSIQKGDGTVIGLTFNNQSDAYRAYNAIR